MKTYKALIDRLSNPVPFNQAVILPDFFLDHFVITDTFEKFIEGIESIARQGGGNLLGSKHLVRRGGNSANTAAALHALGADPTLIVTTDEQGKKLLESLVHPDLNLDHVHTDGRLSATVSIELEYDHRRVNLMVSDSGSASSFSFDDLTEDDLNAISDSGLVCLLNLNHNSKALELAQNLFKYVRESSNAITFLDIGDPSGKPEKLSPIIKHVIADGLVDVLGMNENEAGWFAWALSGNNEAWRGNVKHPDKWILAAELISNETGVRSDLHTPYYSASIKADQIAMQPSFEMESKILCGAGDAWNAGSIYGLLSNLPHDERLVLANAVAALYVSFGTAEHPTLHQVISFLETYPSLSANGTKLLKLR